jgi:uncharacterized membrane protein
VTDGSLSFVIFLYGEIQWPVVGSNNPALAGVNAGDGIQHLNVSKSLTEEIININTTSNIGVPGVWIFQVNGDDISMDIQSGNSLLSQYVYWCLCMYECPN